MSYIEIAKLHTLKADETVAGILHKPFSIKRGSTFKLRHLVHDFPVISTKVTHMIERHVGDIAHGVCRRKFSSHGKELDFALRLSGFGPSGSCAQRDFAGIRFVVDDSVLLSLATTYVWAIGRDVVAVGRRRGRRVISEVVRGENSSGKMELTRTESGRRRRESCRCRQPSSPHRLHPSKSSSKVRICKIVHIYVKLCI